MEEIQTNIVKSGRNISQENYCILPPYASGFFMTTKSPLFDSMKNPIELLFNLQKIELESDVQPPPDAAEIVRLRQNIPAPILAHYDRMRARDKKGVSTVRNSVCSECHMRLASGVYAALLRKEDILICDTCGRYLFIPQEQVSAVPLEPETPKVPIRKRRKKNISTESPN